MLCISLILSRRREKYITSDVDQLFHPKGQPSAGTLRTQRTQRTSLKPRPFKVQNTFGNPTNTPLPSSRIFTVIADSKNKKMKESAKAESHKPPPPCHIDRPTNKSIFRNLTIRPYFQCATEGGKYLFDYPLPQRPASAGTLRSAKHTEKLRSP